MWVLPASVWQLAQARWRCDEGAPGRHQTLQHPALWGLGLTVTWVAAVGTPQVVRECVMSLMAPAGVRQRLATSWQARQPHRRLGTPERPDHRIEAAVTTTALQATLARAGVGEWVGDAAEATRRPARLPDCDRRVAALRRDHARRGRCWGLDAHAGGEIQA